MNPRLLTFPLLTVALGLVACGSSDDETSTDPGAGGAGGAGELPPGDIMGPTADNPCGLQTDFLGDENCILPPDPAEGLQLHVGPSSYDDPDVLGETDADGNPLWIMEPGTERTQCYHIYTPNEEGVYYFEQQYRMRAGSHHMIIQTAPDNTGPEGWGPCNSSIIGSIGGTQSIVEDLPPGGVVPPEDEGLGRGLEPHTSLDIQLHFYNPTDEPTLREIWVNFWYKPKEEVTTNLGMLGGFVYPLGGDQFPMGIPPQTSVTVGNECTFEQAIPASDPVRVVTLFGHAHTHNTRFAVWHDKANGTSELVYDSYEGAEAPTYTYNSVVQNPAPDPGTRTTGASSGQLLLHPGEQLRFACDITNDTEYTFTGGNEVESDEMCNLFGSVAGLGFPCFTLPSNVPVPAMP